MVDGIQFGVHQRQCFLHDVRVVWPRRVDGVVVPIAAGHLGVDEAVGGQLGQMCGGRVAERGQRRVAGQRCPQAIQDAQGVSRGLHAERRFHGHLRGLVQQPDVRFGHDGVHVPRVDQTLQAAGQRSLIETHGRGVERREGLCCALRLEMSQDSVVDGGQCPGRLPGQNEPSAVSADAVNASVGDQLSGDGAHGAVAGHHATHRAQPVT